MLITPPDLAWVLLVLEGCGPGPWAARRHRLRRCLLTSGFTVVWLLRHFAVVAGWVCSSRSAADPSILLDARPCRSTAPTLQFLYYAAGSIRNICARPGQRGGDCAAGLGEPGLPWALRRATGGPERRIRRVRPPRGHDRMTPA